jgi:endonuclease YncB( thermonuclease family)
MLGCFIAILTFRRRDASLTGPAKAMDVDTIVVADQPVSPHGIDAPELDQTFWWRGQRAARSSRRSRPAGRGRRFTIP